MFLGLPLADPTFQVLCFAIKEFIASWLQLLL